MCSWRLNFCHNVAFMREKENMTKKEMAQILGISVDTLRKIEAGDPKVRTNAGMLCKFCNRFEISADAVLSTKLQ